MLCAVPCRFSAVILLVLVAPLAVDGAPEEGRNRPNILVILADDMGYSDLGCYGSEISTPNLDALATGGLRYAQFYNTARCWPTRSALLTGYYAQQVAADSLPGVNQGGHRVRPAWGRLLPELLKPYGYHSYHAGKWHINGSAIEGGFQRSYRMADHNRFFTPRHHSLDGKGLPKKTLKDDYYVTTGIADYAIDFLREHHAQHQGKPFFEYVAFTSPHFPLHAPADDIARYAGRYNAGWDAVRAARWERMQQTALPDVRLSRLEPKIGPPYDFPESLALLGAGEVNRERAWDSLSPQQQDFQAAKMEIHAAMIDRMDQEIGRIVTTLKQLGEYENTVIFFLSDNGASAEIMVRGDGHDPAADPGSASSYLCLGPGWSSAANTPFRRHKTWVHEGGIATSMIVHWPAHIEAPGAWRQAVGHVIDIAPTILELAGGRWPEQHGGQDVPRSPGRSLVKTFSKDIPLQREALWWFHEGNRAIRAGDWKLVAARNNPWELYDLSEDRAETRNLADRLPDRVAQLSTLWNEYASAFQELATH